MNDRREHLLKASNSLREIAASLQALTDPSDHILPVGLRSLLNAIDEIDFVSHLASETSGDRPKPGAYLRQQRERASLSVEDLALRLSTHPELDLCRRVDWIRQIESGVALISAGNAAEYLRAVRLDLKVLGHAVELIRDQRDAIIGIEAAVVEVVVAGIDGGGLDDLLGLTLIGRHRDTKIADQTA